MLEELGKTVIFFSHVNLYSKKNMGFLKNRTIIQDLFKAVKKKNPILFIDPSEIVSVYGQEKCMIKLESGEYDSNHYTDFMKNILTTYIMDLL